MNLSDIVSSGMRYVGDYDNNIIYRKSDVVAYQSKSYVCKVNSSQGVLPTNITNWGILADSATVSVNNTGSGTDPANFVLQVSGNTITLYKG